MEKIKALRKWIEDDDQPPIKSINDINGIGGITKTGFEQWLAFKFPKLPEPQPSAEF